MKKINIDVKILDKMIYVFMIIFLLSLSVSIFVNQIGYYFALIVILIRYAVTKENQFEKTGLELIFVCYFAAEIIAFIFTTPHGEAFHNLLKRFLLIPTIYTTMIATTDFERAKKYFKIYIGASLITVLIYLFFAYKYFIFNLYSVEGSGPSLFQYPITAAEILSFTVIFLFAFWLNEKTSLRNKILLFLGFAISALALVSTYKRGAWLGVILGIFIVMVVQKKWKLVIPAVIVVMGLFLTQKNISEVKIYNYSNGNLQSQYSFNTEGRAYGVYPLNTDVYISDYNNGLINYNKNEILNKMEFPSPVISLMKWKDNYFIARLIDTRFFLLKRENDNFKKAGEFLSPGFTTDLFVKNNFAYVLDRDSGITVFKNPENLNDIVRYSNFFNGNKIYVDSTFLVFYAPSRNISLYKINNGLPGKLYFQYNSPVNMDYVFYTEGKLFVSGADGLKLFAADSTGFKLQDNNIGLSNLFNWEQSDNKLFASDLNGNLYELQYPVENKIEIISHNNIGFSPQSIVYNNNQLFFTRVKRSRLLSIFDPYLPSNYVRFELWSAGWKMFKDHPFVGVGDIGLQTDYKKYKNPYDKEILGHMHNNFMHILVTIGIFGFLAVGFLLFKLLFINYKILKETRGVKFISSYALGTFGGYCAFLISGMTEFNFGDHEIITLVYFTFGLNLALYNLFKKGLIKKM